MRWGRDLDGINHIEKGRSPLNPEPWIDRIAYSPTEDTMNVGAADGLQSPRGVQAEWMVSRAQRHGSRWQSRSGYRRTRCIEMHWKAVYLQISFYCQGPLRAFSKVIGLVAKSSP